MKKIIPFAATIGILGLLVSFTLSGTLHIGASMPAEDVEMQATDGNAYELKDLKGENGLLVIFSCNTCPFVIGSEGNEGWDGRYNDLYEQSRSLGIGMVLVNSNEAKRDKGDSMDDMIAYAQKNDLKSYYVLDKDHVVADAFEARTTPHVFLFGRDLDLKYKGAIDDNVKSADSVTEHWLGNAMSALRGGKKIDPNETKNMGCSIKRVKPKE